MGPARQNPSQRTVRSIHMCVHCTVHNCCAQYCTNRPDNFPSYPPDNHHCSDDAYLREGGASKYITVTTEVSTARDFSNFRPSQSFSSTSSRIMYHHMLSATLLMVLCLQCFDTLVAGWQEGHPACKKWGDGAGGHWLVRMEWHPARWSICLPLLIFPCTIKSRSCLLAPAHPGGPGKRAVKRLWCGGVRNN